MQENYWIVINLLQSCVKTGNVDADVLKNARFRLYTELDKRLVCNLPTDETKRLLSVLNGLYDMVTDNE